MRFYSTRSVNWRGGHLRSKGKNDRQLQFFPFFVISYSISIMASEVVQATQIKQSLALLKSTDVIKNGAPGGIRTFDQALKRRVLYR